MLIFRNTVKCISTNCVVTVTVTMKTNNAVAQKMPQSKYKSPKPPKGKGAENDKD